MRGGAGDDGTLRGVVRLYEFPDRVRWVGCGGNCERELEEATRALRQLDIGFQGLGVGRILGLVGRGVRLHHGLDQQLGVRRDGTDQMGIGFCASHRSVLIRRSIIFAFQMTVYSIVVASWGCRCGPTVRFLDPGLPWHQELRSVIVPSRVHCNYGITGTQGQSLELERGQRQGLLQTPKSRKLSNVRERVVSKSLVMKMAWTS
jgi:hypothetical protein